MADEDRLVALAVAAEGAGRFEDMTGFMEQRVRTNRPLSAQERDLLSAGFKGALESRRQALFLVGCALEEEAGAGNEGKAELVRSYKAKVQAELNEICQRIVQLLEVNLLPKTEEGEPLACLLKLKGDYLRYRVEAMALDDGSREAAVVAVQATYQRAKEVAARHLMWAHPVRLGLALNVSVFQHEVLMDTALARATAREAVSGAISDIDHLPEEAHEDAAVSLARLRANLDLWSGEEQRVMSGASPRGRSSGGLGSRPTCGAEG